MKDIPLIPIWNTAYRHFFISYEDPVRWTETVEGHPVQTAPLVMNTPINLLHLSSDSDLSRAGLVRYEDVIRPGLIVDMVYVRSKSTGEVIGLLLDGKIPAEFKVGVDGAASLNQTVTKQIKKVKYHGDGDDPTLQKMLTLHKVAVNITFPLTGSANLLTGTIMVGVSKGRGNNWSLEDAETGVEVDHRDVRFTELVEYIEKMEIVGFTVKGRRGPKVVPFPEPVRKPSYVETEARMVLAVAQDLNQRRAATKRCAVFNAAWQAYAHLSIDFQSSWLGSEDGNETIDPSGYPLKVGEIVTCMDHRTMRRMILVGTPLGTVSVLEKYAHGEEAIYNAIFPDEFPVMLKNVVCGQNQSLSARALRNLLGAPSRSAPNIGDLVLNLTRMLAP